jgi:hypothetical protein
MYERIFLLLQAAHNDEKALAREVFMWLTYARQPLSCLQLQGVLFLTDPPDLRSEVPMDYESAIVLSCGGLVDISLESYRFTHLSVKEFLQSDNPIATEFSKRLE